MEHQNFQHFTKVSDDTQWRNDTKCRLGQILEAPPPKLNFMSTFLKQFLGMVCFEKLPCPWFIRYLGYIICDYAISFICFNQNYNNTTGSGL